MKIGWIGGWGLPTIYIEKIAKKHLSSHTHQIIYPGRKWLKSFEKHLCDQWIGYSLGGHLLMREGLAKNAIILCPFQTFGNSRQIHYLKKLLYKDPIYALNNFYKIARIASKANKLPYPFEDLIYGLDLLLETPEIDFSSYELVSGMKDLILKPHPQAKCLIQAGHDLEDYIDYIANGIQQ